MYHVNVNGSAAILVIFSQRNLQYSVFYNMETCSWFTITSQISALWRSDLNPIFTFVRLIIFQTHNIIREFFSKNSYSIHWPVSAKFIGPPESASNEFESAPYYVYANVASQTRFYHFTTTGVRCAHKRVRTMYFRLKVFSTENKDSAIVCSGGQKNMTSTGAEERIHA